MRTDPLIHLDYETRSAASLFKVGAFPYAEHPTTRILMFAIAADDDEPLIWDIFNTFGQNAEAAALFQYAVQHGLRICAHNCQFEHAISKYVLPRQTNNSIPTPKIDNWRCTAAMCRKVAIPHALGQAAQFLKLPEQKDQEGKRLINKFSIMKEGDPELPELKTPEDRKDWELFCRYCIQDVRTEQDIYNKLRAVNFDQPKYADTLASFLFDAHMNDAGIPVDITTLTKVVKQVNKHKGKLAKKFVKLTGLKPTQRAKVLAWLNERGSTAKNMQADTVTNTIEKDYLKGDAKKAMFLYSQQSFAAIAKLDVMIRCANADGRVRGTMMWGGAIRTLRWSGQKMQPQNMRKPSLKNVRNLEKDYMAKECARAFQWLKDGRTPKEISKEWQCPYLEVVASVIRQFIQEQDGDVHNADYSSIEARLVPFIVGDKPQLKQYAEGADLYIELASKIFGVPVEDVTGAQRFIGKIGVLGCCYGIGKLGFANMLEAWGWEPSDEEIDDYIANPVPVIRVRAGKKVKIIFKVRSSIIKYLRQEMANRVVKIYRESNPLVVTAWRKAGKASMAAINNPNKIFKILNGRVQFLFNESLGFPSLRMRLPSGKELVLPYPRIELEERVFKDDDGEDYSKVVETLTFYGKMFSGSWGRTSTYGAKLIENVAQGLCADVMSHGAVEAQKKGYQIWMLVHDEALCSAKDGTLEGFTKALCKVPKWLPNFPLESDGATLPYYTK